MAQANEGWAEKVFQTHVSHLRVVPMIIQYSGLVQGTLVKTIEDSLKKLCSETMPLKTGTLGGCQNEDRL